MWARCKFMFFQFLSPLFLPTAFVKINVVNQTRVGFLGTIFRLRERNKISLLLAYILHKTWNWALLCYSGAKTAKKCTKKCDALAKLLFCLLNLFLRSCCRWAKCFLQNKRKWCHLTFWHKRHMSAHTHDQWQNKGSLTVVSLSS